MDFIDTLDSHKFGSWTIVLQQYDDNGIDVFNVSIEKDDDGIDFWKTATLDIFESREYHIAYNYYKSLVNSIIITNDLKEVLL